MSVVSVSWWKSQEENLVSVYIPKLLLSFCKQELILVDKAGWFFEVINTPQKTIYMIETLSDLLSKLIKCEYEEDIFMFSKHWYSS